LERYWPVLVVAVGYLVVISVASWLSNRRRRAERQQHEDLVNALARGDEVVTAGGVYGTIEEVHEQTVLLRVAPDVRLKLDRRAIRRRQKEES